MAELDQRYIKISGLDFAWFRWHQIEGGAKQCSYIWHMWEENAGREPKSMWECQHDPLVCSINSRCRAHLTDRRLVK